MSIEDGMPPIKTPEDIVARVESSEEPKPSTTEVPAPEDPTQTPEAKAERETARLARVEELRQQLGVPGAVPEQEGAVTTPEAVISPEDRENISIKFRQLAEGIEELSLSLNRGKFKRVVFNPDELRTLGNIDNLGPSSISRQLAELLKSVTRIDMPEDRGDMMALKPDQIIRVTTAMEEVKDLLVAVRITLFENKSVDLKQNAREVKKVEIKMEERLGEFDNALRLLRKINR